MNARRAKEHHNGATFALNSEIGAHQRTARDEPVSRVCGQVGVSVQEIIVDTFIQGMDRLVGQTNHENCSLDQGLARVLHLCCKYSDSLVFGEIQTRTVVQSAIGWPDVSSGPIGARVPSTTERLTQPNLRDMGIDMLWYDSDYGISMARSAMLVIVVSTLVQAIS
jgi:hypothetical protein